MSSSTFLCIDAHTCGNPVRVIAGGIPFLAGKNIIEKRLHFLKEFDWIRKALMFEPRGHDLMSGSMIFPPSDPQNDAGILFLETSGCLPMCGHGTIGTVTIALEEGLINPKNPGSLRLETPAGLILISYTQTGKKIDSVKLTNVPSFLHSERIEIDCPGLGKLSTDVAFGGNFYAIIDPQNNFEGIQCYTAAQLIEWSRKCRHLLNESYEFVHPLNKNIRGLSHVMWTGMPISASSSGRNAVFYGEKAIDRSPCGTGTSARMAQLFAKGMLSMHEKFIHESIIGSTFTGVVEAETIVGNRKAIIPSIEGWAIVYGYNTIKVAEEDPYALGFQVI